MSNVRETKQGNDERLVYIEFCLIYKGEVSRSDITNMFSITSASATRDLMKYNKETNNKNCYFDEKTKHHIVSDDTFVGLFEISNKEAMYWIKREEKKDSVECLTYRFQRVSLPNTNILSPITRAINKKSAVKIKYLSLSAGESERIIVPHSYMDDGLRIYIRAYDRKRSKFLEFSASRITNVEMDNSRVKIEEREVSDTNWNQIIDLILTPHPGIKNKGTIEYEYRMTRGELTVKSRASSAGYFLRSWAVDCSEHASLSSNEHQLHLRNNQTLKNIESIQILAPK